MKTVQVRITEDDYNELVKIKEDREWSMSQVVRYAIGTGIDRLKLKKIPDDELIRLNEELTKKNNKLMEAIKNLTEVGLNG